MTVFVPTYYFSVNSAEPDSTKFCRQLTKSDEGACKQHTCCVATDSHAVKAGDTSSVCTIAAAAEYAMITSLAGCQLLSRSPDKLRTTDSFTVRYNCRVLLNDPTSETTCPASHLSSSNMFEPGHSQGRSNGHHVLHEAGTAGRKVREVCCQQAASLLSIHCCTKIVPLSLN